MGEYRPSDKELVESFLGQPDRHTHSGLRLSESFSWEAFELVFNNGSVLQRSAVRQALLDCISLPSVDPDFPPPVRHATLEKHLHNWLLHVLNRIVEDPNVDSSDRRMAHVIVQAASPDTHANFASENVKPLVDETPEVPLKPDTGGDLDMNLQSQIAQALKEAFGVELKQGARTPEPDQMGNNENDRGWVAKLLARQSTRRDNA
jgi:hypothetical protein